MKKAILVGSLFAAQIMFAPALAIPSGSYTKTCKNIREIVDERSRIPLLIASCKNRRQEWKSTKLFNYRTCKPDTIDNADGELVCQR